MKRSRKIISWIVGIVLALVVVLVLVVEIGRAHV